MPDVLGPGEREAVRTGIEAAIAFWGRVRAIAIAEHRLYRLKREHAEQTLANIGDRFGMSAEIRMHEFHVEQARQDFREANREINQLQAEWFATVKE